MVSAQSGNSVISGNVKDAAGLAVPNAKVIIKNIESGVQVETVTNESGLYRAGGASAWQLPSGCGRQRIRSPEPRAAHSSSQPEAGD